MTRKQKIALASIFIAVVAVAAMIAGVLNYRETQEGVKDFRIEVISDRDEFSEIFEATSDKEYLGEFLRTMKDCEWEESEYGIYITGFYGMKQDFENQYWWCITINDQEISLGADAIPLQDGDKYTFTLLQGW